MAQKNNIRSIRFSDELAELIDRQQGQTFTQKFENLITRCVWELPRKEEQLQQIQERIRQEQERLAATVLTPKGLNRNCVGRDARTLLGMIGVNAPADIRCIVFEGEKEHPLIAEELMMPILGLVRAKDIDDAIEKALWLEHGNRHSAHIHSKNIDNITKYAREIDTAILVKNAPSYAALGFGGEGYCTFTIASRTGEGLTSAKSFTKSRRCVMADSLCIR